MPLVSTFHTLARVKAEGGDLEPAWRDRAEAEVIGCSDAICVSCPEEERQFRRLYGDPPGASRSCRRPSSTPSSRPATAAAPDGRSACRPTVPVLLFVGRIQPLKAPDVAIRALAALGPADPTPVLVIVGGASGADGDGERVRRPRARRRARRRPTACASSTPQPHHILSSYYRAADVVIVPSRSESFGLVALEAAACGVPVVASAVGGLLNVVARRRHRAPRRRPRAGRYARRIGQLLDDPVGAAAMGAAAAEAARGATRGASPPPACGGLYADLAGASPPARRLLVSRWQRLESSE